MLITLDKARLLFESGAIKEARILEAPPIRIDGGHEIVLRGTKGSREAWSLCTQRNLLVPKQYICTDTAIEELKRIGFQAEEIIVK